MVKILKTILPKHRETLSPWVRDFVQNATTISLPLLPRHLGEFPSRWPFPRGDLYHWISLLNRFDSVLESFCSIYRLHDGPQTREFTCELLERESQGSQNLEQLEYAKDGDRQIIEAILDFSRMLLQNCGNRSIYASSPYLSDLLNSTSLSLLASTLQIGAQLAQRYQASYKRMASSHRQAHAALLANHYNIDLDKVQQLAQPFVRTTVSSEVVPPTTPATPSSKGKEKAYVNSSPSSKTSSVYANDLVSIAKSGSTPANSPKPQKGKSTQHSPETAWNEWGDVRVTYYQNNPAVSIDHESATYSLSSTPTPSPVTPTPVRRNSTLGTQHGQRTSRLATSDESSNLPAGPQSSIDNTPAADQVKVVEIPRAKSTMTPIHELLKEYCPTLPRDTQFELLTKLRVARALTTSVDARREILAVRILAVTNLAYIHKENDFVDKVLKQDGDEPRRLQLIYQLADLIHPPSEGDVGVPRSLQTVALCGLKALAQHPTKYSDVCGALNTSVNHGVLLYIVRKAVAEMALDEIGDKQTEKDDWRDALFYLLSHVATLPRAATEMVTAGLVPILVELLTLRTSIAERNYPAILQFLDQIIGQVREGFQILVSSDGLEAISDLIVHEVHYCSTAAGGQDVRSEYQSPAIDYKIPFFSQQSLKWLFKFIHHMMTTAGGYGGNFDRLLRNLIDSSQLLASLKEIIGHAHHFGSAVWTNSVGILNDFINNEPTSFAVIAEAGLSRELLQAVTGKEIKMTQEPNTTQPMAESTNDAGSSDQTTRDASEISTTFGNANELPISQQMPEEYRELLLDSTLTEIVDISPHPPTRESLEAPRPSSLAHGIMPSPEAITIIPQAFGAICLNSSGMQMFQSSNALESFFEIFESPKHVQCMALEHNLASNLGSTFDELVRHHPPLKNAIINAILDMVARVGYLCESMASKDNVGAKLYAEDQNSNPNPIEAPNGKVKAALDTDVEMGGTAIPEPWALLQSEQSKDSSPAPYINAVASFLSMMIANNTVRSAFMEKGGTEHVLNMIEVPSMDYDFGDNVSSRTLQTVICMLAEHKPHLVVPSLLKRAQSAADILVPFSSHKGTQPYFEAFVSENGLPAVGGFELEEGTQLVKALVNVHCLVSALHRCFQTPVFNHRTTTTFFNQVNLADYYIQLVQCLGPLLAAATREDFTLQKAGIVPALWKRATRVGGEHVHLLPSEQLEEVDLEGRAINDLVATDTQPSGDQPTTEITSTNRPAPARVVSPTFNQYMSKRESESPRFKNFQTLRFLLGKMPPTISSFFQILGKALTSHKRNPDQFLRQSYTSIAEALAETVLEQLRPIGKESTPALESTIENYTFWIVMLGTIKDLLVHVARHSERPLECITLVLQAFKARKGFEVLNHMLDTFSTDIRLYNAQNRGSALGNESLKDDLKLSLATLGTRHILSLYLLLVNGKNISESPQTISMLHQAEREKSKPGWLSSGQLIVELRMAVLPTVRRLWESDMVEKATHQIPNRIIDIVRTIAMADHEGDAYRRSDKVPAEAKSSRKYWKPNSDNLKKLMDAGFDRELANEALYRCNNAHSHAAEYCRAQSSNHSSGRNPIPVSDLVLIDLDPTGELNGSSRTGPSTGTVTPIAADSEAPNVGTGMVDGWGSAPQIAWGSSSEGNDDLLGSISQDSSALSTGVPLSGPSTSVSGTLVAVATQPNIVTIDDLNEQRKAVRDRLIERCLDVINAHGEVTFEVSDLISTVVNKSDDSVSMRKEMGETLVNALMSFAAEDDVRIVGKKVAAYAHLLALMLREKSFYNASVAELKENLPTLLEFVKLSPSHSSEESSPWIAHILLIIETLLSEDAQPHETDWKYPSMENKDIDKPVLKITEPIVSPDHRSVLFEYILDILPRIGKDESLALAVLRVLVILTRSRDLAQLMGEKKNIQRMFVMAKQLASATSYRLQSPLMLILRHIIEDDDTIRQVIRSEVKSFFESPRSQRHHDVSTYIHTLANLAIRAPELFVEVTNEMVKLAKWVPAAETAPGRQGLMLKDQFQRGPPPPPEMVLPPLQATGLLSLHEVKPTTEAGDTEAESTETAKLPPIELPKVPVVENPDGVIHFLLCEILNYKDVEDKDPTTQPEKISPETASSNGDAIMMEAASSSIGIGIVSPPSIEAKDAKKTPKTKFNWEDHPIFIYRCFLLQCLTELLSSYNRTKVEFINFKRSVPPQAMTPSKPRSTVINYFLSDLVPITTLEHAENTFMMKKQTTSTWAKHLLTGLLSKTGEHSVDHTRHRTDPEDEPDLHFVRKFVLENILKAYKDSSSSTEPLDVKYARMMSLADLVSHIMAGKDNYSTRTDPSISIRSGGQLKRIMFEKGFVAALTGSIADIDLNFPGAKRAVKHILRPLKTLTQTAIELSEFGIITNPGQSEEDEIESASSVSDIDDEREETPDLFRNSTLGMFEPGREEESSSDSEDEDEEMYEGEYDEEMDYGDDMAEDDEDNVSDEDEDIEGMGPIEGLPGDVNVEVILDEHDDEDDEDDDDEDESDEDDDEDSDDMDGDEHPGELIIDEHGHPVHLEDGGDEDDWEDEGASEDEQDDAEEEDYEGRLEDEDHLRAHGIDPGDHGATIGSLMRALGGDDHEGAVEILQRIEDEGLDEMEQYPETEPDDEEDEEDDDEDMEIEEEQFEGFRPPPGMEAVVWDEDSFQSTSMAPSRHGHHHRSRHGIPSPFPYFPGGPRDPLGGTFSPFSTIQTQLERTTRDLHEATRRMNELTEILDELQGGSREDRAVHQSRLDSVRSLLDDLQSLENLQSPSVSELFNPIVMPPRANTNQRPVPEYGRPSYRSHRPGPIPVPDEGMNPLLRRNGSGLARDENNRQISAITLSGRGPHDVLLDVDLRTRGLPFGEGPAALLNDLITSLPLPGPLHRHGHALHFHVTGGPRGEIGRDLQAMFGMTRGLPGMGSRFIEGRRETVVDESPGNAPFFSPQTTVNRWTEEAKLLFGAASYQDKAFSKLVLAVMAVLIPPALQVEINSQKVLEEAKKKRELEEVAAKAKKEAEEKAAKEKAEAEAKEARLAAEAAERARAEEQAPIGDAMPGLETAQPSVDVTQPMEGVETDVDAAAVPVEGDSSEDLPRIIVTIRGNRIDITELGIDADFLRELPAEYQEEVITNAVAERRSQAAAAGGEPSEIDQEFLDALPAEIRDEIIQQERQDRRRREREEARRQAAQNGQPSAAAQEMDAASILATLAPDFRRQVLMEQNEEVLAHLPPEYVAQARAGMRENPVSNVRALGGGRSRPIGGDLAISKKPVVVQMLDKAGVATLLRLMFVFQQDSLRGSLYQVLENISQNRHNRGEVISTLLHILQDGSADMSAMERGFAQLSLRAKQPKEKDKDKDKEPKTPQPLKRTLTGASTTATGTSLNLAASGDLMSPLMVVHQCLSTLIYLSKANHQVTGFFLIEHESGSGLKRSASRLKGKSKDTKAAKFALNSLLSLLDRKLIMESSAVMESLSDLLSRTTGPLQSLARNRKKWIDEAKASQNPQPSSVADTTTSVASPETTTTVEQATATSNIEASDSALQTDAAVVSTTQPTDILVPVAETSTPAAETSVEPTVGAKDKENEKKKDRIFQFPTIPDSNLKLVVNIFVARECSAKTFRDTLITIKNLSCIPGAKAVFGKELVLKAQELGEVILLDLQELLPQIQKATTGTEIQGLALAKFSPSGSDQNKLLRVLTALDHLFDSKQNPAAPEGNSESAADSSKDAEKQDLLAILYENSTFGPMWEKLSACLSAIRLREHMLSVATILLPLIESLMVVCKNTTLKETPLAGSQLGREMNLTSPPPESRMENLFFTFTEEHRKILNDLVRHSPKLMSGTFSLLVKNPKVLEFDNKRNYFTRSIHNRNTQTRQSFPPLQLSVRRDQVFHDSFKSLYFKNGDEMKFGKLSIRFHGEEGVDAGGVTREWFQVLSRQMFDPGYALFVPVSSDRTTFHPNSLSNINPEHLMFFKFIGRVIGKALYEGRVLDCHFSRAVYKRILGKAVSIKDMESLDPEYYKSVVWMLENDTTDIMTETFSVDKDNFGIVETIDLIENGRNIAVTEENKQEYIRLMVEYKLTGSVKEQLDEFLKGFHDIIPAELIAIFNEQELELLISGLPEIDVDDWKGNTEYHNYTASSPQIQWFWRAIRSFDKEERAKLLQFVTGTSKVPLNGFKELEGMNGFSRFNIHRDYGNKDRLPSSHTCFNQLDLPEYESYEALRQQVLMAITAGSEYFGFA